MEHREKGSCGRQDAVEVKSLPGNLPVGISSRMCRNLGYGIGTFQKISNGGLRQFYLNLKGQGDLRDKGDLS